MVVINYRGNSVTIYDGKGLKLLQKVKVAKPRRIAQDHEGNLYVLSAASVHVFAPGGSTPYNTAPIRTMSSGISDGEGLAVDSQENVYVANYSKEPNRGNSVAVYADGSNAPTKMITQGVETPFCLAIDASQNLYVGNQGVNGKNSSVTVYASGTLALTATITSGVFIPTALAFDPLGNLYVADGEEVTAYSPGKFNLIRQIGGFGVANALAFSTEGDAYVTDIGRNTVTMYTAKNDSPTLTLRQGIASPSALVLEPR
jgi:sugar lactone lactonase YvrE